MAFPPLPHICQQLERCPVGILGKLPSNSTGRCWLIVAPPRVVSLARPVPSPTASRGVSTDGCTVRQRPGSCSKSSRSLCFSNFLSPLYAAGLSVQLRSLPSCNHPCITIFAELSSPAMALTSWPVSICWPMS